MDNLSFKRIWQDDWFFQIEATAVSEHVRAKTRSYTTADKIDELASQIARLCEGGNEAFIWENGEKGDESTPSINTELGQLGNFGKALQWINAPTLDVLVELALRNSL